LIIDLELYPVPGINHIYEKLPKSVSIIVKITDSKTGNRSTDMTSFYIAKGSLTGDGQIEENILQNVKLYPNPANSELNIEFCSPKANMLKSIDIYSSVGNLVKHFDFSMTGLHKVNIEDLADGVYIIHLYDVENYRTVTRFIKQK